MERAIDRLKSYLESTIEAKEQDQLRAEGELSALRSTLATLIVFSKKDEEVKP